MFGADSTLLFVLSMTIGPLLGAAGGVGASWLRYRASARAASGDVETSDARTLWDQSQALIRSLTADLSRVSTDLDEEKAANAALRIQVTTLQQQVQELRAQVALLSGSGPS
jgi:hypothetical protein